MGVAKVAQSVGTAEVAQSPSSGHALSREDVTLLKLLAQGLAIEVVARRLCTSERTVRRRIRGICDRLGVGTPIQAVVWAARQGLL
jgi:DNA-binding NarL/FixJ family response regulator